MRRNKSFGLKDYKTDAETIRLVSNAIKSIKENSKEKINLQWLDSLSNIDLDSLVMEIFELDYVTKHTIDYQALKDSMRILMKEEIIRTEKEEEKRNNKWLKYLNKIESLGFFIIQNNKDKKINEVYIKHKDCLIFGMILGNYNIGVQKSLIFFNGVNINSNKKCKYIDFYQENTEIFIGHADIKDSPEDVIKHLQETCVIQENWINSNVRDFINKDFFSDYNKSELSPDFITNISYYNQHDSDNPVTFNMSYNFKDKFYNAFNKLNKEDLKKIKLRSMILNINQDSECFFKDSYINFFNNNNIKNSERSFFNLLFFKELEKSENIKNPFLNMMETIKTLDIDDCIDLMHLVKINKNEKYSRYKLNFDELTFLREKIRKTKIDLYV